jgi:hypothetical protein
MKVLRKLISSLRKRLTGRRRAKGTRAEVFSQIYRDGTWTEGTSDESLSGDGSTIEATSRARAIIERVVREHSVRSVLDAPCGDFNWMRHVDLNGASYTGCDIVANVVEGLNAKFAGASRRFVAMDLVENVPPAHDLIVCRDCVMHLPNRDVARLLANFSASGSRLLLLTVHARATSNDEIDRVGGYRAVNPLLEPFNLPKPLFCEPDGPDERPKFDRWLALFELPFPSGALAGGTLASAATSARP